MRDCIRAANLRSSSVTYVTMPMTTFSTMKPTSASTASGGSVMGAGSASPARAVGGLAEMVSGGVRSSVYFTKDGIDGAHDGHDVGDLHAGQDVRQHREVGERSAAPLEPVGLRPAVGDELTADLAARALDASVASPFATRTWPTDLTPGRDEMGPSGSPSRTCRAIVIDSRNSAMRTR